MNNRVAIVILNYITWQDTVECLQTVLNITSHPWRVIVVDNDSRNDSLGHIKNWLNKYSRECLLLTCRQAAKGAYIDHAFVLIQASSNQGYAAGNNIGIRWAIRACDDYILILNNDTLVEKDFLEPLVGFLDTNSHTALVGPKIVRLDGSIDRNCARRRFKMGDYFFQLGLFGMFFPNNPWCRKHYYIDEYDFQTPRQVDIISGACMLIRTNIIKIIGLLDDKTFLYLEEPILHEKLRSIHKTTFIIPKSQIVHKGGQTSRKIPSQFIMKNFQESLYYYLRFYRYYPEWLVHIQTFPNRIVYWIVLLKYHCLKIRLKRQKGLKN